MLFVYILYIIVIIALGSLFGAGQFFSLDFVMPEKLPFVNITSEGFIWRNAAAVAGTVLPADLIQKGLLFGTFFLISIGSFLALPIKNKYIRFAAALFLTFNPYTFGRLLSGQFLVLIGYGLFIQIVSACFRQGKNWLTTLFIWLCLTACFSVHFLFISVAFVLLYVLCSYKTLRAPQRKSWIGLGLLFLILAGIFFVTFSEPANSALFSRFDHQDLLAFQTQKDPTYGVVWNILSGFGFWYESVSPVKLLKTYLPVWPVLTAFFMLFAGFGFWRLLKTDTQKALVLGTAFVVSLLFGIGIASPRFTDGMMRLYDTIPFLYVFREPAKLVGVILVLLMISAAIGAEWLLTKGTKWGAIKSKIVLGVFMVCAASYAVPFIMLSYQWIKPAAYPASWNEARSVVMNLPTQAKVIVFPWKRHLVLPFAGTLETLNMAKPYFGDRMIVADNYGLTYLNTHNASIEQKHIDGLLSMQWTGKNSQGSAVDVSPDWGRDIKPVGASYILLLKNEDLQEYQFLSMQPSLDVVYENESVILYESTASASLPTLQ